MESSRIKKYIRQYFTEGRLNIFRREQRSLFGEILDWMLTPMLLIWPISLALTWLVAQNIANNPFDRTLLSNAQALAQLVQWDGDQAHFSLPQQSYDLLRADGVDQFFFQIQDAQGRWLGGERQFPQGSTQASSAPGDIELRDDVMRTANGQHVDVRVARIYSLAGEGTANDDASTNNTRLISIQVAETREKRSMLATSIIQSVMLPQLVVLPITMLLIWLALSRGLRPLSELQDRIRARKPDDLSPIDAQAVPVEVSPLVVSVNEMIDRQKELLATQKHFLANAAHQLKTPLAGLRMQADLAQRSDASAVDLKRSLQHIGHSSIRATHTVNQLLALAHAESSTLARQRCNMVWLVQQAIQDCLQRALNKRIDLGYEGVGVDNPHVYVQGSAVLLQEMVRNLIENAIHYTPASSNAHTSIVTARVLILQETHELLVQIEDNGPGIAPAERENVFKPFFRALGNEVDGSGLGLSIVREIARQHNTSVQLETSQLQGHNSNYGALFSIRFAISNADSGP